MRPHARLGAPFRRVLRPPAPGVERLWPRRRRARARPAGLQLHLASLRRKAPAQLAHGPEIEGNVILHPSAKIGRDCKIGPNVSIGIECVIEDGARISNSVLLHRVKARLRSVMLAPAPLAQGVRAHTPARLHPGRCMLRKAVAAGTSVRGTRGEAASQRVGKLTLGSGKETAQAPTASQSWLTGSAARARRAGEELCARGGQHHRLGLLHRQVGAHRQQVRHRRGRAHQGARAALRPAPELRPAAVHALCGAAMRGGRTAPEPRLLKRARCPTRPRTALVTSRAVRAGGPASAASPLRCCHGRRLC